MRLSKFIAGRKESILGEWEAFARTIQPPAATMNSPALRDHASQMLDAIIRDLDTAQSPEEQSQKSFGLGGRADQDSMAERHADQRLASGFTIGQLVSEYRALRASVLKLWAASSKMELISDPEDVTRFNEAIDQALAESVARYSALASGAIEAEQRRLDAVLQVVPVGICLADKDGKLVMANAENRRIWGDHPLSPSAAAYGEWRGWWADRSARRGHELAAQDWALARALNGEEDINDLVEIEPFGSPGVRRTIMLRAAPIKNAALQIIGSVGAQIDVTEQVETQAALIESEAKFRTIADAMPQMVWSTRPDGFHDYYNRGWYEFTGASPRHTEGNGWNGMFHPEDQDRAWATWNRSLATGEPYEIQYRLRHRSGQYRWTLGRALPIRSDEGQIIRWMGTCTDIHDQKLTEQELQKQGALKDQFLAMLAHELRNPLAPISAAAELLAIEGDDVRRARRAGEIIRRQVRHMTQLVDDLLDVSRVTRGFVELEKEGVDLRDVLNLAIEQVRPLVESRKHQLHVRLASAAAFVDGDKTRLVQVVANLLTNAAKYTSQGGNIWVAVDVDSATARVEVKDDGMGIAPALLPHIFDLFSQGERTPDRAQGGLGLGLSLAKHVTMLHGGQISAESAGHGQGSSFSVVLPTSSHSARTGQEISSASGSFAKTPVHILIVDDNVDAGQSLAALLEASGHDVQVVEDAKSVLDLRGDLARIQVFILDIGLPGMNGYELARRLRADPLSRGSVLIALTGYGQPHDRVLSKAAGFDHHVVKPANAHVLMDILSALSS